MEETPIELTKTGKPRKRRPKKKIDYFTADTQKAILEYISSNKKSERNRIYRESIHPAFYKLAENLIFTYGFYKTGTTNLEDLKYEVESFLIPRIDLYKEEKGKAYSYFGTIAKRYLIMQSQKHEIRAGRLSSLDEISINESDFSKIEIADEVENQVDIQTVYDRFIIEADLRLFDLFETLEEVKAADALLEIFKKRDELMIFNKKAIYLYVKEIVDVPSKTITRAIEVFKGVYKEVLDYHIENVD